MQKYIFFFQISTQKYRKKGTSYKQKMLRINDSQHFCSYKQ
jgi:hypothetical protein